MALITSGVASFRFSTDDFPERERSAVWREFFGRQVARLDIEPMVGKPYRASARMQLFPDLGLMIGDCSGAHYRIVGELINNDDVAFITSGSTNWFTSQAGRQADLTCGDAVPLSNGECGSITHSGSTAPAATSRFACISVPRRVVSSFVSNLDDALARPIPAKTEALRMLHTYLRFLDDMPAITSPDLARLVAIHVHDLVALAIGASRDAAEVARGRGLRAARLAAIKADIADNLERNDLSAATLAARHRVSPRYIHKLFEGEGTTLSRFVLGLRLQRVYRAVTDPCSAGLGIGTIAFDAGFSDLSNFNHAFRRQFGAAPSDVRAAAAGWGAAEARGDTGADVKRQ
jgi:AraC-like DNA-binding protein